MAVGNYYLVTALPVLGDLGSVPPITPADLMEHVAGATAEDVVAMVLLSDDLLQRDAVLAGELEQPEPAVLSRAQARNEEPMPAYLQPETNEGASRDRPASDAVWEAYFRRAAGVATRRSNAFLGAWVAYEVGLRNALANARAKVLDLDPETYLVAADLADRDADFSALVGEWADADNPLEGLRVLDRARWQWLADHDAPYSFADDELAAYAAKLMLLVRWHRMEHAEERNKDA